MLVISPIWLLARMLGMNWLFPELDRELPSEQRRMFRMCASGRTLEKQVIPARQADFSCLGASYQVSGDIERKVQREQRIKAEMA